MGGGLRLISMAVPFICLTLFAGVVFAGTTLRGLRLLHRRRRRSGRLEETMHGVKIVDDYGGLEDGTSPETQKWVAEEMAYTRGVLDPLPGRDAIHKRLTELLSIGSLTQPQIGGKYYFYTRRDGMQNQPVLYVREGVDGKDRVLVDANQLAADGTIALDWYQASENGKYLAYGTSPSGSGDEHAAHIETRRALRARTIERTRACSIAWMLDNSDLLHAISEEGRRAGGAGDVQRPTCSITTWN